MAIEVEVGAAMTALGLTLATAESCTGGLLGHRLTNVPGSSAYYVGGFVAYSYEAKELLLGVRHQTLEVYGAVSEETARELARGARQRLGTDIAVSVTGIAGPTGATADKPVGLVYIAMSAPDAELCERHVWQGDRLANKDQSVEAALHMLLSYLQRRANPTPAIRRNKRFGYESINNPVNVEAQARGDRRARPLAFHWRGRRFQIESWGREGAETRQGRLVHCHLVQTEGPETWELCQEIETAQWTLTRHWANRQGLA